MNYYSRCDWFPTTDHVAYASQQSQHQLHQPQSQFWAPAISAPGYHSTLDSISGINFDAINDRVTPSFAGTNEDKQGQLFVLYSFASILSLKLNGLGRTTCCMNHGKRIKREFIDYFLQ